MKVLILAPNAGVSLSSGGGTNFVLKQARALAQLGHRVTLAGFHSLPLPELSRMHGVALEGLPEPIRLRAGPGSWEFRAQRRMPGKPSPYFALLDPRVTAWIRTLGERERPDAVWFHDDVPRAAREWAGRARAFLYVHFPLAARSASVAPPLRRTRGRSEAAQEALLRRLRSRLVVDRPQDLCESIQTNSRVTQRACGTVWGSKPTIWPTYVSPPVAGASGSAPSAVSLAAFHQGKGLEMLLRAFARTTVPEARITLLGHLRDPTHLGRLRRLASAGAGARRVRFVPDASREQVLDAWRDARLVVSSTEFEPFGLSLVEGMSYGIPAIARSSAWSGAWTDVLEEGRFGDGFGSLEELTGCLDRLLGQSSAAGRDAARARSAAFSEPRFVEGLRKVFGG